MNKNSFYGNQLKEVFPDKSRIVRDNDSTGAKLFDCIGSHIEQNYRRKIFKSNIGCEINNNTPLNMPSVLYKYDLTSNSNYLTSILGNEIIDITECENSFEEFYSNDLAYKHSGLDPETIEALLVNLKNVQYYKDKIKLTNFDYVFVNVKKLFSIKESAKEISITIRGKDSNYRYIEEKITIDCERVYKTKQKFKTIEGFSSEKSLFLRGGNAIDIEGILEYEIDILQKNCQSFYLNRKRYHIQNLLSRPLKQKVFLENSLIDNDLLIELENIELENSENISKLNYIHRYFNSAIEYRVENNVDIEDNIFEEVLSSCLLTDENGENLLIEDITYDEVNGCLYGVIEEGTVYKFEIGNKITPQHTIQRTEETKISLDTEENFLLPKDEYTLRLTTSNLDFPIKKFLVGKIEDGVLQFLEDDKVTWSESIFLHDSINVDDIQDSLEIFTISETMGTSDVEYFTVCFEANSTNLNAINSFNLLPDKNYENFFNKILLGIQDKFVNSKIITCNINKAVTSQSLISSGDQQIKNIYLENNDRDLILVNSDNVHSKYILDEEKYYYYNHCIYRKLLTESNTNFTFNLSNGESVVVTV